MKNNEELHFPLIVTEDRFEKMVMDIAQGKVYAKLGDDIHIPSLCGEGVILNKEASKVYEWERQEAIIGLADLFDIPLQYFLDNGEVSYDHWD